MAWQVHSGPVHITKERRSIWQDPKLFLVLYMLYKTRGTGFSQFTSENNELWLVKLACMFHHKSFTFSNYTTSSPLSGKGWDKMPLPDLDSDKGWKNPRTLKFWFWKLGRERRHQDNQSLVPENLKYVSNILYLRCVLLPMQLVPPPTPSSLHR